MEKALERYIGRIVEIIYQGCDGKITQRQIEVRAVQGNVVKAYCLERQAPRVFRIDNILAVHPASRRRTS